MTRTLLAVLVGIALGVGVVAMRAPTTGPLRALEQRTRATPALAAFYDAPTDDTFMREAQALQNVVEAVLHLSVEYEDLAAHQLAGYTMLDNRETVLHIDKALGWTARLEVLAHEAAHRLHPPTLAKGDGEVFAEAVSYLVCLRYGHDELAASSRYLAARKENLHVLTDYRAEIAYATAILSGAAR